MTEKDINKNRESSHLAIVSQFAIDILSLNTNDEIIWHLARNVVSKLDFVDVVIYLYDEKSDTLYQKAAFGNKNPESYNILSPIRLALGTGIVGKVASQKSAILIKDTRECDDYILDDQNRLSELAVPMIVDGQLIGVIDSEHPEYNFFTETHKTTLTALASITATKLDKNHTISKLHKTIDELEYSSKIQDSLFEIAELIFETETLDDFYQRLHTCIGRLTFAKNFIIALATGDGNSLVFTYGSDEFDIVPTNEPIPYDIEKPSITGYVLKTNKGLLLYEEGIKKLINENEIYIIGTVPKAWLGVPFGEGELRGVVVVQSYSNNYLFDAKDKQLLSFVAKHIRNAIERMKSKADLKFLALHDPLTRLPNRLLFTDRVEHAISRTKRDMKSGLAVLFLDLDRFKQVNDNHGHHVGDKLLIAISQLINSNLRASDTLCRLGGDEFAILVENISSIGAVEHFVENIISEIKSTVDIGNHRIDISVSIGVSYFFSGETDPKCLLVQADEAMYQAKLRGRNQVYYAIEQVNQSSSTYKLERDFLQAIKNREFYLQFQPIVNLSSGDIVGAESLIRWQHSEQGVIQPDTFLPEIERAGYMSKLDIYVVELAINYIKKYHQYFPNNFKLNINVSSQGFVSDELINLLEKNHHAYPKLINILCIEITEQTIVDNIEKTQLSMEKLSSMGITIALDDFGTGYSSLSYLNKFNFDTLKIDRSFIKNLDQEKNNHIILNTIINLAKSLNIKTVGEGIEDEKQYRHLNKIKCVNAQGYFMSKPVDGGKLLQLLNENTNYKNLVAEKTVNIKK